MIVGALISGLALGSVGQATQVWQVYLLFTLFGIGNAGIHCGGHHVNYPAFPGPQRSIALAVASTGLSLGGVVITPVSAWLLSTQGVSQTMPWLGLVLILILVPLSLLIKQAPGALIKPSAEASLNVALLSSAVNSRFYVLMAVAYVLIMAAQAAVLPIYTAGLRSLLTSKRRPMRCKLCLFAALAGALLAAGLYLEFPFVASPLAMCVCRPWV